MKNRRSPYGTRYTGQAATVKTQESKKRAAKVRRGDPVVRSVQHDIAHVHADDPRGDTIIQDPRPPRRERPVHY